MKKETTRISEPKSLQKVSRGKGRGESIDEPRIGRGLDSKGSPRKRVLAMLLGCYI